MCFILFGESTGEPRSFSPNSEPSLKGDYEKQSDQRTPRKRARNIGWSRWHACQPADEVHAGGCNRGDVYICTRWTVETSPEDTVFPPWATNRIFRDVSLSNERDEGVTRSRSTEVGGRGTFLLKKGRGTVQRVTRRGAASHRRIESLEMYARGTSVEDERSAEDVHTRAYSAGYVSQKKHKIITRTTRQAAIEHEDARRCAFNTPLTRLRPGASAAKLFRRTDERNVRDSLRKPRARSRHRRVN